MDFPYPQGNIFFNHSLINNLHHIWRKCWFFLWASMKQNTNIKYIKVNLLRISWEKKGQNNFKARKSGSTPLNSYPVAMTKIVPKPEDYVKILSSLICLFVCFFVLLVYMLTLVGTCGQDCDIEPDYIEICV